MKKILLVGDSHIQGLYSAWTEIIRFKESNFDVEFIMKIGSTAYSVDFSDIDLKDTDGKTILICFGEVDIRRRLPRYDNAAEVATKYIQKAKDHFKNNRIVFLQPTPQALTELTHEFLAFNEEMKGFIPYTLEERLVQQNNFYRALEESGEEVITMAECLGVNFTTEKELEDGCHLNRQHAIDVVRYINKVVD
jgi:hypothetical protein